MKKLHIAEIILILIILFDGAVTLTGLNKGANEGNPIVASIIDMGWIAWFVAAAVYIAIILWLYQKENPARFAVFGSFLFIHLFGAMTWLSPLFKNFIYSIIPDILTLVAVEFVIGIGFGLLLSTSKKWRTFLDKSIKIPV